MLDDLDKTLEQLLRRELPTSVVNQVSISFAVPDSQFPPQSVSLPAIDLFLYDVRENRDLRSNEWIVERRSDGTATEMRAPVRLDCSYLITAWAPTSSTTPALDEHQLLGAVIRVLVRYATLPVQVLQGNLSGQEPSPPVTSLNAGRLQSISDFWQALGGKPRAALNYTVTISVTPDEPVLTGAPVVEKVLKFGLE